MVLLLMLGALTAGRGGPSSSISAASAAAAAFAAPPAPNRPSPLSARSRRQRALPLRCIAAQDNGGGRSKKGAVVEQKKKKKSKSKSAKEPAAPLVEEVEHVDLGGLSATEHSELISDIKSCGNRRGGWKLALQMLEDVKVNGGHRTAGLVHATMVACTNQRHMAQAVALLEDMRTSGNPAPDKFCYDAGIHAYRLLRDREKALELLAEMPSKGLEPTSYTYSEAIRSCRNTRDGVKVAEDLMRDYIAARGAAPRSRAAKTDLSMLHGHHHHDHHDEELPVVPRKLFVCYSYLWVLAAAKEWRKATVFLQAMAATEETPDRVCYNAAIKACSKAGMWREATRLLDQQRYDTSRGKKVQKIRPDEYSYTMVIIACAKEAAMGGLDKDEALGRGLLSLKQMRMENLTAPEPIMLEMYKSLINACLQDRAQWERAIELFNLMIKSVRVIPGSLYRSVIHILYNSPGTRWKEAYALLEEARAKRRNLTGSTYNMVITLLGRAGRADLAKQVFQDMVCGLPEGQLPSVDSYKQLISACAKCGQWEDAMEILEEMTDMGLQLDDSCYSAAINACANAGEWEKAVGLLITMRKKGLHPNLYCFNCALRACAKVGLWEKASSLVKFMNDEGVTPDVYTYNSLIEAYAGAREWDAAMEVVDTMREAGVKPDSHTFGCLINACTDEGRWERALWLLDEMRVAGLKPNVVTFTSAISTAIHGGRIDVLDGLLVQMRADGVHPNLKTYSVAISVCARARDVNRAHQLLIQLRHEGLKPDLVVYSGLISASEKSGSYQKALDYLEDACKSGLKPNCITYTTAMSACQSCGQNDEVVSLFHRMRDEGVQPDEQAYNLVLTSCRNEGWWHLAEEFEKDMLVAGLL